MDFVRLHRPVLAIALALAAGGSAGLFAFAWMRYGEAIYLTRLASVVAGCF